MTTIELFKAGKWNRKVEFPTVWDELTAGELSAIAVVLINDGLKQQLLLDLIDGRAVMQGKRMPKGWRSLLDPEQGAIDGLPLVDGLLMENNRTVNPFPMLRSYYGPEDDFNDLLTGEYEDAEVNASLYLKTRDPLHLATMGAILWRPLDRKTRKRVAYEGYKVNAASFSKAVTHDNLQAIHLWFLGCRGRLPMLFPDVFAAGTGSVEPEAAQDLTGFTKLIHHAAGPKNGTRAMVRRTQVKELLFDCQLAIEEAQRMEEEMKRK